jgi:hypothetical protein
MQRRANPQQIQETFKRVGYDAQHLALFHSDREHRIKLLSGGEGAGKSLGAAFEVVAEFPFWDLVYIVAPKYEQAKKEFDYIKEALILLGATNEGLISNPVKGQRSLKTVFGQQVITLSAEDGVDGITGTGASPDLVLLVECGKVSYDIFLACRGRVARSRGLLILSGTIESSNRWYPEFITRWQADNPEGAKSFIVPTWDNLVLYPGGKQDDEIVRLEKTYPPDVFLERFGAVPCPPSGLVFREFSFIDHVKPTPTNEEWNNAPIELAVDPGFAGAYAVLAIKWLGDSVQVFDEVYRQFTVAEDVIAECKQREWWSKVKGGVIDIAGRQHQGLPSHIEIWQAHGITLRSNTVSISDGILRHRTFLRNPFTGKPRLFHDPKCKGTLAEYGRYKYREVIDGKPVSENPIDADNHAMKALAYWLYDRFGATDDMIKPIRRIPIDEYAQLEAFTLR